MLDDDYARSIIDHMNEDHAEAVLAYVQAFSPHGHATGARMTSIDAVGMDIEFSDDGQTRSVRVDFPQPLSSDDEVRPVLIRLVKRARRALAESSDNE